MPDFFGEVCDGCRSILFAYSCTWQKKTDWFLREETEKDVFTFLCPVWQNRFRPSKILKRNEKSKLVNVSDCVDVFWHDKMHWKIWDCKKSSDLTPSNFFFCPQNVLVITFLSNEAIELWKNTSSWQKKISFFDRLFQLFFKDACLKSVQSQETSIKTLKDLQQLRQLFVSFF